MKSWSELIQKTLPVEKSLTKQSGTHIELFIHNIYDHGNLHGQPLKQLIIYQTPITPNEKKYWQQSPQLGKQKQLNSQYMLPIIPHNTYSRLQEVYSIKHSLQN